MSTSNIAAETQQSTIDPALLKKSVIGDYRRIDLWKDVSELDWEDWHWQVKNRICKKEELSHLIKITPEEEEGINKSHGRLAMAITPYWANLMDPDDSNCPIRKQAVPVKSELKISQHEMTDPCAEDRDSPVPGLVHRYPDRVLLLVTEMCFSYCRHCTRRRMVGEGRNILDRNNLDKAIDYIRSDRKIRDVLISGGDPFMLEDNVLEEIIKKLRSVSQIEFLRIGTRAPVTLPQRITIGLVNMLKKYSPIWISIHFNHPREITKRCKFACDILADNGFPLGSQTVLLKGVNDRPYVMRKLMHELLEIRVRPYYIYQCDPAKGTSHFRTPISVGINIMEKLRGHTSGYAVPTYVVDAPGGGGKIPVGPNYLISEAKDRYTFRNYKKKIYTYIE
ncbi:MAG: KamA family radical SAM protein [Candidatus Omnitrophica bacterium]|nr:KamA family radical SAM protein [Candidatus Omnitrophota bacterium]MDD5351680.1 KamA family radical SAM protein [Candidatus Omnitrophota bacterium]MDD5550890.1 KamA family radical SAM protein [Candidatus Omnitrophota bacterium]